MKQFTVKDFINYNSPCFSCGQKISIKIGSLNLEGPEPPVYLRPSITGEQLELQLSITYTQTLKLVIIPKFNKILTSNLLDLTKYLEMHKLFLYSSCAYCYTSIHSCYLQFNLKRGFILPVSISSETLMLSDDKNMYQVVSYFMDNTTKIIVDRINKTYPIAPIKLNLPLLPLYKLKTKERIINKIKTYIIFS